VPPELPPDSIPQDGIGRYAGWAARFRSAQISRLYGVIRGADLDKTGIGADDPVGLDMPPKCGSFGVVFLVVPQNDNFLTALNSAVVLVGRAIAIKEAERGGSIGAATPDSLIHLHIG
jgi:hypothetical protein